MSKVGAAAAKSEIAVVVDSHAEVAEAVGAAAAVAVAEVAAAEVVAMAVVPLLASGAGRQAGTLASSVCTRELGTFAGEESGTQAEEDMWRQGAGKKEGYSS